MGPYIEIIKTWLEEDKSRPRKQRHTARRIYNRLKDEYGFVMTGSASDPKDYQPHIRSKAKPHRHLRTARQFPEILVNLNADAPPHADDHGLAVLSLQSPFEVEHGVAQLPGKAVKRLGRPDKISEINNCLTILNKQLSGHQLKFNMNSVKITPKNIFPGGIAMTKTVKKRIPAILVIVLLLLVSVSVPLASAASAPAVKNVILMIPDGMSVGGTTLARWYKGGTPLAMDEMACGLVRTYSSDAAIADSAPAATAFSTGFKSHTGYVAVLPDMADMPGLQPIARGDEKKPVATILEAAKLAGKATGLVVTCEIPHATPAAFSAHYPDRNNYDDILEQQVYSGIDVVLGGGSKYLTPEARKDKEDLIKVIKDLGYDYVTTPEALRKSTSNKLWGMFAPKDLSYDFDRDPAKQPSLAEMTSKAIEVFSKDKDGFFLMVEGSKIDWAAHANDPVGVISDILAFDNAVKVALDFAKKDKHTVVIAVTDHGNGGITIGDRETSKNYDELPLSTFIEPLKRAKLTGEGVEKKLNADRSNIKEVMATYYGITDLTEDEIKAIKEAKPGKLNYVVGPMISKRAHIGWTTNGHTGEDVVLYVYSPTGDRPTGVIENTDIARYMERILGLNLQETTKKLFVPARTAFEARGTRVEWDDSVPNNPVIVVIRGNDILKLPVNKNLAEINGKMVKMNGLTVYNGVRTFVPQEALDLLN